MNIHEFMQDKRFATYFAYNFFDNKFDENVPTQRTRIILVDGESVSVQASETHYCSPRDNSSWDDLTYCKYYEFELGFPSLVDSKWLEYAEQPNEPLDTVYGYVPAKLVQKVLDAHGGIDVEATLAFKQKREEERKAKQDNKQ